MQAVPATADQILRCDLFLLDPDTLPGRIVVSQLLLDRPDFLMQRLVFPVQLSEPGLCGFAGLAPERFLLFRSQTLAGVCPPVLSSWRRASSCLACSANALRSASARRHVRNSLRRLVQPGQEPARSPPGRPAKPAGAAQARIRGQRPGSFACPDPLCLNSRQAGRSNGPVGSLDSPNQLLLFRIGLLFSVQLLPL